MPTVTTLPMPTTPTLGSRWRYFNGGTYTILHIARHSEDQNHFFVVYQHDDTGEVIIRDRLNFLSLNDDGHQKFQSIS